MIKFFRPVAVAAVLVAASGFASAQASAPFTVSVTLTPTCTVKSAQTAANIAFGTYTAFQTTDNDKTGTVTYQCSSGVAPQSIAFTPPASGTASAAGTGAPVGEGVLNGLRYTLTTGALAGLAGTSATPAAAGANGTGGTNSGGSDYTFTIAAKIPAGQGGVAPGTAASATWALVLAY